MNINMANSQYLELFKPGKSVGSLSSAKVSVGAGIKTPRISRGDLACSVSISEESKAKSEQLNEEKKQEEPEAVAEQGSISTDGNNCKIVETTISHGSEKYRFVHIAFQCDTIDDTKKKKGKLNLDKLASAYKETVEELNSQYSGKYLDEALNLLDKEYKDALDYIANAIKTAINFGEKTEGKEGEVNAIEAIFGMKINDFNDMLSKMGIDKNKPILDNIDAIMKILAQQAEESNHFR